MVLLKKVISFSIISFTLPFCSKNDRPISPSGLRNPILRTRSIFRIRSRPPAAEVEGKLPELVRGEISFHGSDGSAGAGAPAGAPEEQILGPDTQARAVDFQAVVDVGRAQRRRDEGVDGASAPCLAAGGRTRQGTGVEWLSRG